MKPSDLKKIWLPVFLFSAALIIFYKLVDKLPDALAVLVDFLGIFSPIVVAAIIAFILYIPQNNIEKLFLKFKKENFFHKHSRGISVFITYLLLLGLIGAGLYFVLPAIVNSIANLVNNLPSYYNSTLTYVKNLAGQDGKIWGVDITEIDKWISLDKLISYFDVSKLNLYISEIAKVGSGFFNFLLSIVMSVYMLCSHENIILTGGRILHLVFKKRTLYAFYSYVARGCEIFYDYLYGSFLDALIVSVELSIALSIFKIPYGILLGIFIGLLNLIPYFGSIISGVIAVLTTYIVTGNYITAIIAFAVILIIQQIDANLVQPRIVGASVGVKPFYVLVAITLGGALFGFVGILISVPLAAFIKMLIIDYMRAKNDGKKAKIKV